MSSNSEYTLLYWPGEFVRLAFEYAKHPYNQDLKPENFMKYIKDPSSTPAGAPHAFAPPMLHHKGSLISQTPNILLYLGDELKLNGSQPMDKFYVNELTLTVLDLNNEIHDTHHPISVALYYEDQLEESKKKAKDVRENRIPKFFDYFNNVLKSNGSGYLVGNAVTYADLALFQVVDGIQFAFPNCMKRIEKEGKYAEVFKLKKTIENTPQIAEYLQSEKRQKYSMGVFRHYPELDE
ncbi:glutathione S-transferase [Cystobasidium minutum MCA 4210]|uniref:glutathione S-transferase n=1 Tax=Cystobasidium minutum MCA 4210 TaxID=1397322 RepID=UPI0034CE3FFC|eukprot:jgi/Rhomi1/193179/gm1.1393_g